MQVNPLYPILFVFLFQANEMKDSMLKPVRVDAGLGDPPVEYKNNDPESANFIIKHGLHFNASKPHEFVGKIKNIVETQQQKRRTCCVWKRSISSTEGIRAFDSG